VKKYKRHEICGRGASWKDLPLSVLERNNVKVLGSSAKKTIIFAHGFGCDQNMWRFVWPAFAEQYRVVLFDYVGCGASDTKAYDSDRYGSLAGYAKDIIEICRELDVTGGVFVGHSVSAMIGVLALRRVPELFDQLVMIGPSPRYIDEPDYTGGFSEAQINELLDFLDANHMGWSQAMAPVIMGNPDRPELGEELTNSFCMTDPEIARRFARVTFMSDNRADLAHVNARTLVLQCSEDVIAPQAVGEYVHRNLVNSEYVVMQATGHCPNLSAPQETVKLIKTFLERARG
jgi:sigma-B regulation protein RsbQ